MPSVSTSTTPAPSTTLIIQPYLYHLDVAVVTYSYAQINKKTGNEHIIDLDVIEIPEEIFKYLFYQTSSAFQITPIQNPNDEILKYIGFFKQQVSGEQLRLHDEILNNILEDLGVTKSMLSICSLINLNKEISSLKSLCDLTPSNVSCSLTWRDILTTLRAEFNSDTAVYPLVVDVILTVSVVFITPTEGVYPTIVRFNYKTQITIPA